ncbi:MAG: exodeoxyribonuclease I, partial [Gammaproteobacteria bacterium]|nr:exodeoxyribonuclease I [Gammaproteobacteria bacterium]
MSSKKTMYWHDYETFGTDPMRDRPAQFAGIRTDEDLNIIGEPLVRFCRPAADMLPQPEACLVTGITPRIATDKGVSEAEFIGAVHRELALPGTCGVGYNTIRFDDEITRYALYRNFFDPYAREWQNGNSRWDIIDMARLTRALRPQGMEWPNYADGSPSFRLEDLTAVNGIHHEGAHDALADVHATIGLARLIRDRQPRLFEYIYRQRDKHSVTQKLNLAAKEAVLHVSSMYPREYGCTAIVVP